MSKDLKVEKEYIQELENKVSSYEERIQFLEAQVNTLTSSPLKNINGSASNLNGYSLSQDLVKYAYYPSAIIDSNNKILHVNKQFERCFGYDFKELSDNHIDLLIPNITINVRKNFNLKFLPSKNNRFLGKQGDLVAIHKNGTEIPVEVGVSYIKTDKGFEILATVIDISERKTIEKSLLKTIERLDLSLSSGSIGVWDWDIVNNNLLWDASMYRLYNIDQSKFSQAYDAWVATIHPEDRERIEAAVQTAKESGPSFNVEFRILTDTGAVKHIHAVANVMRNKDNVAIRMVGVNTDITAEKEAYRRLLVSERQLKAFFDIAPIGIARNKMDGQFVEINTEFERFIGYTKDELNELSYWHLTPDEYKEQEDIQLKSLVDQGKYGPYKKEYIHKDGHRFPVLLHGQILQSLDGQNYIWSTVQDLSQIEQTQLKLMNSLEQLTSSNDELKRFAYVASHDLQEPLRVIMSYLQLIELSAKESLDAKSLDYIKRAYKASKRMRDLIVDLLSFSRVDSKRVQLMPVSLSEIMDVVLGDLSLAIKQNDVVMHLPDNLPNVFGDPGQLQRVLLNLIGNGIKYHKAGTQPVIEISYAETKKEYEFSIKDNGIGIDPEYHDRVFEVFQRLHTREDYSGTGIGLAIVKKIINKHHGEIWFTSQLGVGSTFTFTLPKKQRHE